MRRLIICLALISIMPLFPALGQITTNYQWTALEKQPNWVHAIGVTFGSVGSDNYDWHRFIIGTDETNKNLFNANSQFPNWVSEQPFPNTNPTMIKAFKNAFHLGSCAYYTSPYGSSEVGLYFTRDAGDGRRESIA